MSGAGLDIDSAIAVYDQQAEALGKQWSAAVGDYDGFLKSHRDYLPSDGGNALDIGAGYGSHVTQMEKLGLDVVAVEPSEGMRDEGKRRYPESKALWLDDRLPRLEKVRALGKRFDFMLMNSVWMHLPPEFREEGMTSLAALLAPGGKFSVLLRHGPAPKDRPMHESDADPFLALAERHGLTCIYRKALEDELNRPGVSFTRLILSQNG